MPTFSETRSPHANRIRLGRLLEKYNGRIFGGIRMSIDKSSGHPSRYKYYFVKLDDEPALIVTNPRYRPPGWMETLRSQQPAGWEDVIQKEEVRQQKQKNSAPPYIHPNEAGERTHKKRKNEETYPAYLTELSDFDRDSDAKPHQLQSEEPTANTDEKCQYGSTGGSISTQTPTDLENSAPPRTYPPSYSAPVSVEVFSLPAANLRSKLNSQVSGEKEVYVGAEFFNREGRRVPNQPPVLPYFHPPFLALDLETCAEPKIGPRGRISSTSDALNPRKAEIRLLTAGDSDGNIRQFDLRTAPALPPEILAALSSAELVIHNAAFELLFLHTKFGIMPEQIFCTLTASRLLEPQKSVPHSLGPVIERYLDVRLPKEQGASDWGAFVLTDEQLHYARDDVRYLLALRALLAAKLEKAKLMGVFQLESALLPIIARMELHGFQVDTSRLASMLTQEGKRSRDLEKEISLSFGDPKLNPASPEQLMAAFKKAGIQLENTEEKTLRAIADPRAVLILEYRGAAKLASAIEGLLGAQCNGRIYARFNPLGAVTGRFSSKGPNLQNIPRGPLRHCFISSSPERRLVIADYSQIELRVAALVANETVMIEAFKRKEDLHYKIAAVNLRKPIGEVTRAERGSVGKSTNFGFIYGQGDKGFRIYARTEYGLVIELEEAARFRNNFFETYPGLRAWHEECWRKAKDNIGEARTIYGRLLRAQQDSTWARFNLWTEYVVSGSCADLLKAAMVQIASILPSDCHLVATVHDELIYDVPGDLSEQYCGMIRLVMEESFVAMFGTTVPIVAEAKVCRNWGEK